MNISVTMVMLQWLYSWVMDDNLIRTFSQLICAELMEVEDSSSLDGTCAGKGSSFSTSTNQSRSSLRPLQAAADIEAEL